MMEKSKLTPGYYWATSDSPKAHIIEANYIVKVYGQAPFLKTRLIYLGETGVGTATFEALFVIAEIKSIAGTGLVIKDGENNYIECEIKSA